MTTGTTAPERLASVKAAVAAAALRSGRTPGDVQLIAVSKTFAVEDIRPVIKAGQRHFGENRVQEAEKKWPALKEQFPDIVLHLIGPLQSNKTREAVRLFDVIHTIDRPKIAETVAAEMERQARKLQLFVEVNTGEEPQKAGVLPLHARDFVTSKCRGELHLDIVGLMCIPPVDEAPAVHFAFLAKLAKEIGVAGLSMGMSADYTTAIEFGATHVRVGSAIFGHRG